MEPCLSIRAAKAYEDFMGLFPCSDAPNQSGAQGRASQRAEFETSKAARRIWPRAGGPKHAKYRSERESASAGRPPAAARRARYRLGEREPQRL